jgi:hypothetical protein
MGKPHWKDAPVWANYLAMNIIGNWEWYEHRPDMGYGNWFPNGRYEREVESRPEWTQSLERKPNWILILHTLDGYTKEVRWHTTPPPTYRDPKRTRITGPVEEMPESADIETYEFYIWNIQGNVVNYRELSKR